MFSLFSDGKGNLIHFSVFLFLEMRNWTVSTDSKQMMDQVQVGRFCTSGGDQCVTCEHLVHIWSMSMDAQLPTWSIGWTANVPDRWRRYGCTTPALVLFESLDFRLYVFQEHRKAFQQPCWDKLQPGSQLSAGLYTGTPVATRVGFILPYSSVVSDNTIRETSPAFHKAIQELIDRFKNVGCLAHWISNWTRRIY